MSSEPRLSRLSPENDEAVRDDLAAKLGVSRSDIDQIHVLNWLTGEVMVSFHSGRNSETARLESAVPRDALTRIDQARRDCEEDAQDPDRPSDERAFYAGQAEGFRLAAQWLGRTT